MKRTWFVVAVVVAGLVGATAVAQAGNGPGYRAQNAAIQAQGASTWGSPMGGPGAQGFGPGMMGNGRGFTNGRGAVGGGRGGMMGGGAAGFELNCTEQNYDPAALVANLEAMIVQHQAWLESLEAQVVSETDETIVAALNQRIEWQELMIAYQQGKLEVAGTLPTEWLDGAIALAQYDVAFFTGATFDNTWIQGMIGRRLAVAQNRLAYLEGQVD